MVEKIDELKHDVHIKARKKLEMSGVLDVCSFDDKEIVVQVSNFGATIEGEELKIEKFNSESGELVLNGAINGIFYFDKEPKKKKALSSLFK